MALVTLQQVDYGVGGPLLLERVDLSIERGERVCVVGRNGAFLIDDQYAPLAPKIFSVAGLAATITPCTLSIRIIGVGCGQSNTMS